jgi:hypothetical protein
MSWSIYKFGTKEQVKKIVDDAQPYGNIEHFNSAKKACQEILDTVPDGAVIDLQAFGNIQTGNENQSGEFNLKIKYSKDEEVKHKFQDFIP